MAPKRSTASAAGRPSKAAKKDSTATACKQIADSLEIARKKDLPDDVITFLGAALKNTLPTYKEDRHEFQTAVLTMVEKTLEDVESVLVEEVARTESIVNSSDDEKLKREAAAASAEQNLEACQQTLKEKQAVKGDKFEALEAALEVLKEAQAKQQTGDTEAAELETKKTALNAAQSEMLAPMKEGGATKRQLQAFARQLKPFQLEDSLLEAMELALGKKPDQRGRFDAVILEQLDLQLSEKNKAFETQLTEAAPGREERAALVKSAQDEHDAGKVASEAAAEQLKAAKKAEVEAKSATAEAKKAVKNLASELADAAQQLDNAGQQLEQFRSGPLASFKDLLERSAPQPDSEELPADNTKEPPAEAKAGEDEPI